MNTPSRTSRFDRRFGVALALVGIAATASAQGKVDARLMQRYGGVLAPECGNYLLPQLKFLGDSLVVQDAGKAVLTGRNVKEQPTYFGAKAPPPEFETALTSEVAPGEAMVFVFYRTPAGLFAAVEGGPKVIAALPAALKGKRVRHCDPNRNAVPGAAPAAQLMPGVLLKDANFKRAYAQALGPLAREPWLMALDGPAQPVEKVQVAGNEYQLVSVCKNHDCYDNNMVVLYGAAANKVYGNVLVGGRATLVGAPPAPVAAELQRLWKATYRSGK